MREVAPEEQRLPQNRLGYQEKQIFNSLKMAMHWSI